jgi:bacterial leucyl aminopeptidase
MLEMPVSSYCSSSRGPVEVNTYLNSAGALDLPPFVHQSLVKPLFPKVSTQHMHDVLEHMTSYYTRYYGSTTGERSALWLHDHIAEV